MKISKKSNVVLIIMALIVMLFMMSGCGKDDKKENESAQSDYKTPISNYFEGMEKANAETYKKAYVKFVADDMDLDKDDMEDMIEAFEDEYGKNIKISYEIKDKEKIESDDLKVVEEYVEEKYDEKVEISDGYELDIKATIEGEDDSETTRKNTMYVYKVDGEWGIISESLSPKTAKNYLKK